MVIHDNSRFGKVGWLNLTIEGYYPDTSCTIQNLHSVEFAKDFGLSAVFENQRAADAFLTRLSALSLLLPDIPAPKSSPQATLTEGENGAFIVHIPHTITTKMKSITSLLVQEFGMPAEAKSSIDELARCTRTNCQDKQ